MKRLSPHLLGLVLALFLGLWHAVWSLLVWTGVAQQLLDLVFRLHMINPPYQVAPFSLVTAGELVLLTAGIGYVAGLVIGGIWNRFHPAEAAG